MSWGLSEKQTWFKEQNIKRSYKDEVLSKIEKISNQFDVKSYGALSINPERYPLYFLVTKNFQASKKTILITGGVHGYETSGVQGALAFFERAISKYLSHFQFVCAPCISPWGYETINRWNPHAIDPNRSFIKDSPSEECRFFLEAMSTLNLNLLAHFDLHETTDTDNTVFRPALEQRDGTPQDLSEIPDGFYLVGDSENPQDEFQKYIINNVRAVTHIAAANKEGQIIGKKIEQEGVVNYPLKKLSLCAGFSKAQYTTTTEVYPDSPKATPAICIEAQIAAIEGGLKYLKDKT
jgi:hypothetical protein